MNVKVLFLTKIDLFTRVTDSTLAILVSVPTRIMNWPVKIWSSVKQKNIRKYKLRQTPRGHQRSFPGASPLRAVATFFMF